MLGVSGPWASATPTKAALTPSAVASTRRRSILLMFFSPSFSQTDVPASSECRTFRQDFAYYVMRRRLDQWRCSDGSAIGVRIGLGFSMGRLPCLSESAAAGG